MSTGEGTARVDLVTAGWVAYGGTYTRGYAHFEGRFLPAPALALLLDTCESEDAWRETVGRLNGCFAVVTRRETVLLAAVDRVRSIPLFYLVRAEGCLVSDSADRVLEASGSREVNLTAAAELGLTGYVTGHETLFTHVYQIEAGESVHWDTAKPQVPTRHRYYRFHHGDFFSTGTPELIDRLETIHGNVFRRLIQSTEGRTIVLPLSGGYDSRLIAVSLRDLGARDVICYSYGAPGNWEAAISKELARYLGFRWEFIVYTAARWRGWVAKERFRSYFLSAGNLASIPHIQDWPAVCELQDEIGIPPDSIFVPGHSGDFLAGSHVPRDFVKQRLAISRQEFLDAVYRAHYSLWPWPEDDGLKLGWAFKRKIESIVGAVSDCTPEEAADRFEQWDLQERQAKFICNSVRVYEDFGYEWRLPLFDHDLMDFWARIPVQQRTGRKLYYDFVRERQRLPVTSANRDRGATLSFLIRAIDGAGLRPWAKRLQNGLRRLRWRREYESSQLSWFAIVDRDFFRQTYSGRELGHSYVALAYREAVIGTGGNDQRAPIIPGISVGRRSSLGLPGSHDQTPPR